MSIINDIRKRLAPGLPREYITCEFCGAKDWGVPPHGFSEPCPHVTQVMDAMSSRVDAERMLAVRSGVHMEELRGILENGLQSREDSDE